MRKQCGVVLAVGLIALGAVSHAFADDPSEPPRTEVFKSGTGGYHTYRIPSLVTTKQGTLLAFAEGRKTTRADLDNHDSWLRRSSDGGRTWDAPQLIYEEGGDAIVTIGNPTAIVDRQTGTVWLSLSRNAERQLLFHSEDDGRTWSKPIDITAQAKSPDWQFCVMGPGIGIQLEHGPQRGRLILSGNYRIPRDLAAPTYSFITYSDDHGKTWHVGESVGPHSNECQVVETLSPEPGLLLNMRSKWGTTGKRPDLAYQRIIARSTDSGLTWSKPEFDAKLVEPHCQASILRYSWAGDTTKSRILFSNPADKSRKNLTVRVSYDEGRTWPVAKTVCSGLSAYSCLTALPDGRIGLLFEEDTLTDKVRSTNIVFTSFTLDWLTDGQDRLP